MTKNATQNSSSDTKTAAKVKTSRTLGCCTISYDNKPDEQIAGITKSKCNSKAKERGGTANWNPGACAEN